LFSISFSPRFFHILYANIRTVIYNLFFIP